jgi:hypothetical protein
MMKRKLFFSLNLLVCNENDFIIQSLLSPYVCVCVFVCSLYNRYMVRGDSKVSADSCSLLFCTTGVLLQRMKTDHNLDKVTF